MQCVIDGSESAPLRGGVDSLACGSTVGEWEPVTDEGSVPGRSVSQPIGIAGAMLAVVAWGASGVLAKAIDLPSLVVVVYRFWLSTFVFLGYLGVVGLRGSGFGLTWRKLWIALPGGLGLAADVAFFFSAVKLTTVANATVVAALQPLLMMYLGSRLLGEHVRRAQVAWSVVALAGVSLLVFGSAGLPEWSLTGDLLSVGALFAWTAYLFFSKATEGRLTPLEYTTATGLITAAVNTPLIFVFGQELSWPDQRSWVLLGAMVFGSGMCAHLLMNWSLRRIPVWFGSTVLSMLIPASAAAMAWLFLGEAVTGFQAAGIAVTLLALVAITSLGKSPKPGPSPDSPKEAQVNMKED